MGDDRAETHIAIIPARAGSKEIKNKNLKEIMGRSLVHHALYSAVSQGFFSQVILTTDIKKLMVSTDGWVIRQRPEHLAHDDTPMSQVIHDVLAHTDVGAETYVWLLQPTSPFRISEDYKNIRALLKSEEESRSWISMYQVEDSHPTRQYTISSGGVAHPIVGKANPFTNRQQLKPCFQRNGLYYVIKAGVFRDRHTLQAEPITPYIMDPRRSHNINTEWDLEVAFVTAKLLRDKGLWPS